MDVKDEEYESCRDESPVSAGCQTDVMCRICHESHSSPDDKLIAPCE